jgi:serine/threonine protein kinase
MNHQFLNINTIFTNSAKLSNTRRNTTSNINSKINGISTTDEPNSNSTNSNSTNSTNSDNITEITKINNIMNANKKNKYNIIKYLGAGIRGDLYLAVDNAGKRFILKKIILDKLSEETIIHTRQIQFELGLLKYLSNNNNTREYVNPCLESVIQDRTIYTIFPVFQGYSLLRFHKYLSKMNADDYYKILFFLIKSLLNALSKIHDTHIAHQNINENSILVSTFINPREIKVKFTDFGLGCGLLLKYPEQMVTDVSIPDTYFESSTSCAGNIQAPVQISKTILKNLSESDYLQIAQKWDVFNLGLIFIKYLLYFESFTRDIDYSHSYNKYIMEKVKKNIEKKYLFRSVTNTNKPVIIFPTLSVSTRIQKIILEYLKIINKFILVPTIQRKSAHYVLDKLIIYEKYKDDIF